VLLRQWTIIGVVAAGLAIGGSTAAATHSSSAHARNVEKPKPVAPVIKGNPLLPPPVAVEGFFPELTLVQKLPTITPAGFDPLYTSEDWQSYRTKFGAAADDLPRKRSSGQFEFANTLIDAADPQKNPQATSGLRRLLLLRAATICYRSTGGYPTANRAVTAYQTLMDVHSASQIGALWTISNVISRMAVTPRDQRIRYSGIAAHANMQLTILLLEADQVEAAQAINKFIGYHDGWLKSDPALRAKIAQTRNVVKQTATMMEYLGTQYQPAINGDDAALMSLYLYGRFVKNDPSLVSDFPSRKPNSPMAQLAGQLSSADRDVMACFTAADTLRVVSESLPSGVLRQRTLYASLERYRKYMKSPETEHERVKRTLALMAIEAAVADGAKPGITIHPFDAPRPATQPATQPSTQPSTRPATQPTRSGTSMAVASR